MANQQNSLQNEENFESLCICITTFTRIHSFILGSWTCNSQVIRLPDEIICSKPENHIIQNLLFIRRNTQSFRSIYQVWQLFNAEVTNEYQIYPLCIKYWSDSNTLLLRKNFRIVHFLASSLKTFTLKKKIFLKIPALKKFLIFSQKAPIIFRKQNFHIFS